MKELTLHKMLINLNQAILLQFNVHMQQQIIADNVVSFVKTYTSNDWRNRKSSQKKKGITRITKMNSQSKQKLVFTDNRLIGVTNQNYNLSNRKLQVENQQQAILKPSEPKIIQELNEAKIQKERINNQSKTPGLVESHYINCQQDVEQWLRLKQKLEERISNLQLQNDFLKKNVEIQLQYIQKIQTEVDILRLKNAIQTINIEVQTEQLKVPIQSHFQVQNIEIQCNLYEKEFQGFRNFYQEVQQQTKLFENLIKQLENEKLELESSNSQLISKLATIEAKMQQQIERREEIKGNLTKEIQNLINNECNLKMNLKSFQQAKDRIKAEIVQQNQMLQTQRQLRMQIQKQKQLLLLVQNTKITEIQRKYDQYRKQLDYLLSFLEQKDYMLTERERKVERDQLKNGFYSERLIKNELQSNSIKLLRNEFQDRINNIKHSMEGYLQELANYRNSTVYEDNQAKIDKRSGNEQSDSMSRVKKERQLEQDMGYLLNKVSSLEYLVQSLKNEAQDKQKHLFSNENLLNAQYFKIQNLEQKLELMQGQYRKCLNECKFLQMQVQGLGQQKLKLQSKLFLFENQKQSLQAQSKRHQQQYQLKKNEIIEQNKKKQRKLTQLQTLYHDQKKLVGFLREQNSNNISQIQGLKIEIQSKAIQVNQTKRHVVAIQNQKARVQYQFQKLKDQINSLYIQNNAKVSSIQSLRAELLNVSHQYQQMSRAHSLAKRDNLKLHQQNIQLKQRFQEIQREIELITKSHSQQIKHMQGHITKMQREFKQQTQGTLHEKQHWEKKIQLIKRDYDVLYNKYLKYKNIALQMQPAHN